DKLKDKEKEVEGLARRIEDTEEASRQSMELRNQLRDFAEQAASRDQVLGEMRSMLEQQASDDTLLRERLGVASEDALAARQRFLLTARPSGRRPRPEESPGCSGRSRGSSASAAPAAVGSKEGGSSVTRAFVAAEVQVELLGDSLAAVQERQRLLLSIEDLRIEKALLVKRAARDLQELLSIVRSQEQEVKRESEEKEQQRKKEKEERMAAYRTPRGPQAHWSSSLSPSGADDDDVLVVPPEVEHHDISSDGEEANGRHWADVDEEDLPLAEPYPAGLLYVQRVSELEAQSDLLKQRLESLHAAEDFLQRENKEKNDLIAVLMRKANLPMDAPQKMDRTAQKKEVTGHWWVQGGQTDLAEDARELEHVIEETTEDNIRLRNDIKIMADELRKIIA
ncbi:unnamed protein product, partial [Polarella glacialis]